jgi:type I restriction enzyme S subunit
MTPWKKYRFSDFVEINPKVELKSKQKYSFVEMKDLMNENKFVQPSDFKELKGGARFQNGDTLFARITPCLENGKICQVKNLLNNLGFGSTEFLIFRAKQNISDKDFVFYLSRSPDLRKYAETKMIGTSGRQRVVKDAFDYLNLLLPPLPEQRRIAEILGSLDDRIELNLEMNKTLEQMAMLLYKRWFVDFEFPDSEGKPYKSNGGEFVESELGLIPKGWEVKKLGEVYKTTSGGTPSRKKPEYYTNGTYFWIKSKELNNTFVINTEEMINEEGLRYSSAKLIPPYTVLIALYGATVGEIGITSNSSTCNQAICAIIENEKYAFSFIFLFLRMNKEYILNNAVGSAQQNISQEMLKNLDIIIPSDEILSSFKAIINPIFYQIEKNIKENQTLSEIRDALLPKLISGEVRVKG